MFNQTNGMGGPLGKRRRDNTNDLDDFSPIRRRFTGEDNVIGIDEGLRNDAGLRKRVSAGGGVHDDIVDITKEIINRQQQQNLMEHLQMVDVSDKLATQMITKVINRYKTKAHLYTYGNLVSIFETMAIHVLNKFEDSVDF